MPPSSIFVPPPFPFLDSCPSPQTRLAAAWTGRHSVQPVGSWRAQRSLPQMGQLSSADPRGEPFICLLMEGHVQHHKGGVSCRDQQPVLAASLPPQEEEEEDENNLRTLSMVMRPPRPLHHPPPPFSGLVCEMTADRWRDGRGSVCSHALGRLIRFRSKQEITTMR